MTFESSGDQANPRKRPISELESEKSTALICTVVSIDYTSIFYTVCSVCERTLPEISPLSATNPNLPSSAPCKHCNFKNVNSVPLGSKRLFRLLMSVATDTKVFVVIMFDRVARVLFGCSADELFDFAKHHSFAVADAGKILEGEMLRVTVSKPKNGNAQHLRVVSVVPLRSKFQPAIVTLTELYRVRPNTSQVPSCTLYIP